MKVGDLVGWRLWDGEIRDEFVDVGIIIEILRSDYIDWYTKTYKKHANIYWTVRPEDNGLYPLDHTNLVSLE